MQLNTFMMQIPTAKTSGIYENICYMNTLQILFNKNTHIQLIQNIRLVLFEFRVQQGNPLSIKKKLNFCEDGKKENSYCLHHFYLPTLTWKTRSKNQLFNCSTTSISIRNARDPLIYLPFLISFMFWFYLIFLVFTKCFSRWYILFSFIYPPYHITTKLLNE